MRMCKKKKTKIKKIVVHRNLRFVNLVMKLYHIKLSQTELKNIYRAMSDKVYPVSTDTSWHIS